MSNRNIVMVEVAIATGVLGHVAWNATMLVITYERLGPIGPGWYLMVRQLSGAVGAPVYAALAGRFRRERVLAGAFLANAAAVALVIPVLGLHHLPSTLLFIPIALEGFTHTAPRALHDALLPWLADSPAQLVASNSFSALLDTAAALIGAGLAATGLWLSGPPAVLTIVAILGVLGAYPLIAIRGIDTRGGNDGSHIIGQLVGGIGVLRRLPDARAIVVILMLTAVIGGFEHSNIVSISTTVLHMGPDGTPVLIAFGTAGGFVGGVASLSLVRRSKSLSLTIGLLIVSVAIFVLTMTSDKAVALPFLSVFGIGMVYQGVSSRTLLQSTATGRSLDLLVGVNTLIGVAIAAVSALCAAELNAALGVRETLRIAAGLAVLGAVYTLVRLTRIERQSPTNREELDAIKCVDAFGPLSVAAESQLADALIVQETAEGEVVVRQGDPADDMFLISSGVFEATVDGQQVRTLRGGDHFGEIALLFNAPRTASVRCEQSGTLWRLRREDFLRAVTGNSTTEEAMMAIADLRLAHAGTIDNAPGDER